MDAVKRAIFDCADAAQLADLSARLSELVSQALHDSAEYVSRRHQRYSALETLEAIGTRDTTDTGH